MSRLTVPVVEEQLRVDRRRRKTGVVRVRKRVRRRAQSVDLPVKREHIDVQRVRMNRVVDRPSGARREGDVLVVPVFEEVVTVQRRWVLKEEIRLRRRKVSSRHREHVELREEQVSVERVKR